VTRAFSFLNLPLVQDVSLVRQRTSHLDIQKAEFKTFSKHSESHLCRSFRSAVTGWVGKTVTWPAVSLNVVFSRVCSAALQRNWWVSGRWPTDM